MGASGPPCRVLIALGLGLLAARPTIAAERWLGAWGYAPAPVPAGVKAQPVLRPVRVAEPPFLIENPARVEVISAPSPDPTGVTVRQIVRVSAAGTKIRLHFSNEAGTDAMQVGPVHVALAGPTGDIVPGSDRLVTFNGSATVAIPSWAPYDSDPITLPVRPLDRLAISIYIPGPASHSGHALYQYVSGPTGDFSSAPTLPGVRLMRLNALVTRVDVRASVSCGSVVALGDSITEGAHATLGAFRSWPDRLAERLGGRWSVVNAGIGGNRLLRNVTGPDALARLDRDVLAVPGVRVLILMEGINDIGRAFTPEAVQEPATLDDLKGAVRQIVSRAHDHGITVVGATLTPYQGAHYFAAAGDEMRRSFNEWIRTSGTFDHVVDFDAAVRDSDSPSRINPLYDSNDHLHFNDRGYAAIGDAVDLAALAKACPATR